MKNFSDITAIDTAGQLEVNVELVEHHNPVYTFLVNGSPMASTAETFYFDLLSPLSLKCVVNTGAIEVAKLTINGYEVLPIYQYLANPATAWITATWEFGAPAPFYPWYHQLSGQGWIA